MMNFIVFLALHYPYERSNFLWLGLCCGLQMILEIIKNGAAEVVYQIEFFVDKSKHHKYVEELGLPRRDKFR